MVLYDAAAARAREATQECSQGVVVEEVDEDGAVVTQPAAAELPTVPDTSVGEAVPEYFRRPGSPRIEVVGTSPHQWSADGSGVYVEELDSNDGDAAGHAMLASGSSRDWMSAAMSGGAPAAVGSVEDGYDSDVDMTA